MLEQRLHDLAPNGIVRLIAHTAQTDFFARFRGVETDGDETLLVFEPNSDSDFKIRATSTAPKDVPNGVMFFGTEDKWRIRAATPEESAEFNAMMESES